MSKSLPLNSKFYPASLWFRVDQFSSRTAHCVGFFFIHLILNNKTNFVGEECWLFFNSLSVGTSTVIGNVVKKGKKQD